MGKRAITLLGVAGLVLASAQALAQGTGGPAHAMAMHGAPKYAADFANWDYVNPDAPKGGSVVLDATGTYDTFNPFIIKGSPAVGLGLIYDTLMASAADEAFSEYCQICETIEVPDDRSWVEFTLRNDAFWHDGKPITVDDVIFSFNVLIEQGAPFYRSYYQNVIAAEQTGPRSVRFNFAGATNLELPLIMGQLLILPEHYWRTRDFTTSTLEPPLGSGPYRIESFAPGQSITYARVDDYWGRNHPTNRGIYNFDEIRYDYFRDRTVAREAFKGGEIDWWVENRAKSWAKDFDVPAVEKGLIKKEEINQDRVAGMQGFVFNTRRPYFADRRVREALTLAFDFETTNKNIFFNAYTRNDSYFDNSELASTSRFADAGAEERDILGRFRDRLPDELFTAAYEPPATDGTGSEGLRANLTKAVALLDEAGWTLRDGKRINATTGEELAFEIMLVSPAFEPVSLPYAQTLQRLGVKAKVRLVDAAQYQNRLDQFDFDMVVTTWGQSLSPGNEQRNFWGSQAANTPGTRNLAGIQDPVIDDLIELIIAAPSRQSLVERVHALDRVVNWGFYVVPHWHVPHDRIAFWDKFDRPVITPTRGTSLLRWWIDPEKEAALTERRGSL